jgi:hypothetical protein
MIGCASIHDRVVVTPVAGEESIPRKIAVYPLLTADQVIVTGPPGGRIRLLSAETKVGEDRLYIVAPAETKLVSNIHSQILTSRLSADLSGRGFYLKELPVEAPEMLIGDKENNFFISLETLKHLREEYGLEAVLIGNVYFIANRQDRSIVDVRAVYLRLVDTATLDVLCHISFDEYGGESIIDTSEGLAFALAREAGISTGDSE